MEKIIKEAKEAASLAACELKKMLSMGCDVCVKEELDSIADVLKDCCEAIYYASIAGAMEEGREEEPNIRRGYNHNRYANGHYAPKGHGNYTMGYHESQNGNMRYMPEMNDMDQNMGYTDYGLAYHNYDIARRHYNESQSINDKIQMDSHAKKHLNNFIETTKEIYYSADPELQKVFKNNLTNMVNGL